MPEARQAKFCGRAAHHCASENHTLIFRLLYFLMSINLLACSQPEKKWRPHVRSFPALLLFHFRLDSVSSPLEFVHLDAV